MIITNKKTILILHIDKITTALDITSVKMYKYIEYIIYRIYQNVNFHYNSVKETVMFYFFSLNISSF